jgi:hypothetical protein
VKNLARQFIGDHDIGVFRQIAAMRVKFGALANYLGRRPREVVRDLLMLDGRALGTNDQVPFEILVQLCHYYNKPLPIPVSDVPPKP